METSAIHGVIGGRYRLHGLLGEGGMARVFDAFDERLERPVAVKILRPQTLAVAGMRTRFQREAWIAAQLAHPNIVAVLDYGEDHSGAYLVMERLPGATLRDEVARGPLTSQRVMLVVGEILGALVAAHRFGVVHRDIKPSNILLRQDGHTKITDFGIAKTLDLGADASQWADDVTLTGVVLGTPGYLAPECRSGRPATARSDLYSVGAVMVEALTGRRPIPGADGSDHLPQPFRDVALRAMAADPGDRFASAAEMRQALGTRPAAPGGATTPRRPASPAPCRAGSPVTPPVTRSRARLLSSAAPARRRRGHGHRRRHRALLVTVGAAALVVTLFAWPDNANQPTGAPGPGSSHVARLARQQDTDPERAAIRSLATALGDGGFSGGTTMAKALDAVAAQPPGAGRQAAAQRALSLAQVLLGGGDITSGQYQDVQSVLQPLGGTEPTTTTSTPPAPSGPQRGGHDRGHDPGGPGGPGDQG
ncbi:MAG: protein kinase domain-containing protein [Acidimicrobiales bacterium]